MRNEPKSFKNLFQLVTKIQISCNEPIRKCCKKGSRPQRVIVQAEDEEEGVSIVCLGRRFKEMRLGELSSHVYERD